MTADDRAVLDALPENELLALTAFLEARDQPVLGIVAVMWVVRNRLARHQRGHTLRECCLAPQQFSCWNDGDPCQRLGLEFARLLRRGESIGSQPDGIILAVCLFLADRVLSERVPDPTKSATHYYNPHTVTKPPAWAAVAQESDITMIGSHKFFRNVA